MSVLKIGRRYGLLERRQAAELTSPANHVRHAAFNPRQHFAATALPDFQVGRLNRGELPKLPQLVSRNGGFPAGPFSNVSIQQEDFSHIARRRIVATIEAETVDTDSWGLANDSEVVSIQIDA